MWKITLCLLLHSLIVIHCNYAPYCENCLYGLCTLIQFSVKKEKNSRSFSFLTLKAVWMNCLLSRVLKPHFHYTWNLWTVPRRLCFLVFGVLHPPWQSFGLSECFLFTLQIFKKLTRKSDANLQMQISQHLG